jgi:hypothetical protein
MDTFCLFFKALADYLLYGVGLWFSACVVAPPLGIWFRKKVRAMRKTLWKRLAWGIPLACFFVLLIIVTVRVQQIQSREQNPIYQHRIVLIHDARVLAKHLPEIAPDVQDNFFESHDYEWLASVRNDLQAQGLNVDKLNQIYRKNGLTQKTLKQMADELNSLATELSKNEQGL